MYLGTSAAKVFTSARPQLTKITQTPPGARHRLEDLLGNRFVRKLLGVLTAADGNGGSLFERLCASYDNPDLARGERWKWALPGLLIDMALMAARLDPELMKRKLFHHRPTVRALALTGRSIARFGLMAPQRYVAPLMVVWNITRACNLRCRHCYQDAGPAPPAGELAREEKIRVVDRLAEAGVPFLAIAGGEPLVSKDLWPTLAEARRRGIHVTVATNGTLLTPETVARLVEAGVKYVEVSIDSVDPEQHDRFRGVPGCWARAIQGIRNSVAGGMRTGLATCFTRETVHLADDMVKLAIDLGCQTFSHFNFIPVGRGRGMIEADLRPEQRERLLRRLVEILQEGRINVISTAPQFSRACVVHAPEDGLFATGHAGRGQGRKTLVLSRYIGGCGAARCYCSIQPNGDVTPCVYIPSEKMGSLRAQSLLEIWDGALVRTLSDRDDRGDHCGVCDYRAYCGGCRARAFSYVGDMQAGDPGCKFNSPVWDEVTAAAGESPFRVVTAAG
jgi:radical SAM protein with 4Fe4S-binding SPASM domain